MSYLLENLDWFEEKLGDYDDDYLLIDCPGQIELYTHIEHMKNFTQMLQRVGYYVCAVYLIDSHFVSDSTKFISGMMMCLSAMIRLELPHINVLTKIDLLDPEMKNEIIDNYMHPDIPTLIADLNERTNEKLHKLNTAIGGILDDYNLVQFIPFSAFNEESIELVLLYVDNTVQYGEDVEPVEPKTPDEDEERENFDDQTFGSYLDTLSLVDQ